MREGRLDEVINIEKRIMKLDHLGDAVAQEQSGGMNGVVAGEVEVRPSGTPRSDAKGIAEAHIATALWATIKNGK